MDVGYILGHQDQYEELRYSLRSLVNFTPGVDQVWVAGAPPPDWSQNINWIPVDQLELVEDPVTHERDENWWYHRKLNMRTNLLRICEHPDVSERFLYMNDDFYLVQPTDATPLPYRGTIANFAAGNILDRSQNNGPYPDIYRHLTALGVEDPVFVSEHVPMVVDKHRLADMMRDAWHIPGFPYASLWGNLTDVPLVDGGKVGGDRLLVKHHLYYEDWPEEWWSASTVHRSFFDWPVGELIRTMFSDPSPYERR